MSAFIKRIAHFWSSLPLTSKISGLTSLLITVAVLALTMLSIWREQKTFQQELADQARLLLGTIPEIMQDELYYVRIDEMVDLINSLEDNPIVTRLMIFDRQARTLADSSHPDQIFFPEIEPLGKTLLGLPGGQDYMEWQADQLLAGKVVILGDEPIGAIAIGLSTEPLDRKIAAIRLQGFVLAFLSVLSGAGITILLARQITNPISELMAQAKQMAGGNLSIRVTPHSKDEIGQLGEAFNQMAQAIQDRENDMRNLAAGLERSVAERTAELKMQNQMLEVMATSDSLTQVFNRRHFFVLAEREVERAKRYRHPLAILMMDADFFKHINDTYGHLFGDQMLLHLVQVCQQSIRIVDILARFGGEEFVILMPESSLEGARITAERLQRNLAEAPLEHEGQAVYLTISIGIAGWSAAGDLDIEVLLRRADRALYQSKQAGRNRTTVWQENED